MLLQADETVIIQTIQPESESTTQFKAPRPSDFVPNEYPIERLGSRSALWPLPAGMMDYESDYITVANPMDEVIRLRGKLRSMSIAMRFKDIEIQDRKDTAALQDGWLNTANIDLQRLREDFRNFRQERMTADSEMHNRHMNDRRHDDELRQEVVRQLDWSYTNSERLRSDLTASRDSAFKSQLELTERDTTIRALQARVAEQDELIAKLRAEVCQPTTEIQTVINRTIPTSRALGLVNANMTIPPPIIDKVSVDRQTSRVDDTRFSNSSLPNVLRRRLWARSVDST